LDTEAPRRFALAGHEDGRGANNLSLTKCLCQLGKHNHSLI